MPLRLQSRITTSHHLATALSHITQNSSLLVLILCPSTVDRINDHINLDTVWNVHSRYCDARKRFIGEDRRRSGFSATIEEDFEDGAVDHGSDGEGRLIT